MVNEIIMGIYRKCGVLQMNEVSNEFSLILSYMLKWLNWRNSVSTIQKLRCHSAKKNYTIFLMKDRIENWT